jgi:phosphate transport system substrate-binding protein
MKSSKRVICQAVVLALSAMAASAAMAQAVQGGGSTLVQPTIQSEITQSGLTMSYFGGGSGQGVAAFLGNNPAAFTGQTVTGTIHFGNSDSALLSSQVSTTGSYALTPTNGNLIQLPFIVTPITIPVVNPPSGVSSPVVLNDADLCGVFSGKITNWNALINPATGTTYTSTSKPFSVVYRTDGSGTSDLLTRHLQAVCTTGTGGNSNIAFTEGQTFSSNFSGGTVPTTFIGESGSGGVASELVALKTAPSTASAFGYLSPDYTNTTLAPNSPNATANQLPVASLVNHAGNTVVPTFANATAALAGVSAPSGNDEKNPFNWVPGAILPVAGQPVPAIWAAVANPTGASAYPIAGTSNIIVSQCYKTLSIRNAMHTFLNDHYNNTTFQSIVNGNGFDTVPTDFQTAINRDILANNSTPTKLNIDLNDTTVCAGIGR